MRQMRHKHCPYKQSGETESDISTFHKTGTLWIFAIVLSVVTILKYLAIVQQRKFATTHIFTFYIDVWYLIVTHAENTTSVATVGINITQQNQTLKLVTIYSIRNKCNAQ